jgi:anhydro-N-acetylmuramic acid kinase
MKHLRLSVSKKKKKVLGVLSGTSVDAVDIALIEISGFGIKTKLKVIDFDAYPINPHIKDYILKASTKKSGNVENVCMTNFLVGRLFANKINIFLKRRNISSNSIDFIGSHGQTIYHYPHNSKFLNYNLKSTLQVGDISVISNLTRIPTIGDFRTADVALGGDGAPLVPYLDYILFRNSKKSRILINIGGIANLTFLKAGAKINDVIAFDTGPGNMLIDYYCQKFLNINYDKDGKIAQSAFVTNEEEILLNKILYKLDPFVRKKPPKSTGREVYSEEFLQKILTYAENLDKTQILRVLTKYTAMSIIYNIEKFIMPKNNIDEIFLSGGGANNKFLLNELKKHFTNIEVKKLETKNGVNVDNKEAVLFAVLANEFVSHNPSNITTVTGAKKNCILGKLSIPE